MEKENDYFNEMRRFEKKSILIQKALDKSLETIKELTNLIDYYKYYEKKEEEG